MAPPTDANGAAMPTTALLFPGQGSHGPGMRGLVERERPDLLELAIAVTGNDPFARAGEATRFAQPAIYAAGLAAWSAAGRPRPDLFAGHSLGEITALSAAGAIDDADGLRLTARRGELMQAAAEAAAGGGMLALLGERDAATALAAAHGLTVANDNAPTQIVVSGEEAALETCAAEAKGHRLKAIRLSVAGAFHSPAMAGAVGPWREELDRVEVHAPTAPVYSSITAAPFERVRDELAQALVRPVRWRETLLGLRAAGTRRFLEAGPSKALTGMVRRTLEDVEATTLEDLATEAAVA